MYKSFFLLLAFFLISPVVFAVSPRSLEGYADVTLAHKKRVYRFQQAILIPYPNEAYFEAIDDFGNSLFRMRFEKEGKILIETGGSHYQVKEKNLKKILSLPLKKSELTYYLLYQIPTTAENLDIQYGKDREVISVEKKSGRKKDRYKINFLDLKKRGKILYPQTIEMVSWKSTLRISWQHLKIN